MVTIELKFDSKLKSLASFDYGVDIFNEQVGCFDPNHYYTIIFPTHIEFITSTFMEGFYPL